MRAKLQRAKPAFARARVLLWMIEGTGPKPERFANACRNSSDCTCLLAFAVACRKCSGCTLCCAGLSAASDLTVGSAFPL